MYTALTRNKEQATFFIEGNHIKIQILGIHVFAGLEIRLSLKTFWIIILKIMNFRLKFSAGVENIIFSPSHFQGACPDER